jgi:hypothetical protein
LVSGNERLLRGFHGRVMIAKVPEAEIIHTLKPQSHQFAEGLLIAFPGFMHETFTLIHRDVFERVRHAVIQASVIVMLFLQKKF